MTQNPGSSTRKRRLTKWKKLDANVIPDSEVTTPNWASSEAHAKIVKLLADPAYANGYPCAACGEPTLPHHVCDPAKLESYVIPF